MASEASRRFFAGFKHGPRQIDLPLAQRREAGEAAETLTAEPIRATTSPALLVGGLWSEPAEPRPDIAILYLFGGGYVLGSPASRRKTAGHLAVAARASTLVPNYRLAPEHPFPAALDDAVAAYVFLRAWTGPSAKLFLVGDSAGGGLALAAACAIRDHALPPPAGVVALSPWADLTCSGESACAPAGADLECTKPGLLEMADWYLAGGDPRQPLASPVFATFKSLPPILCLVGGEEILLDDTLRIVRAAGAAGGDATAFVAGGMQHVFPIWAGVFPEADAAIGLIADWIVARA